MDKTTFRAIRATIILAIIASKVALAATPVSPNASPEAKALLDYLYGQFGKKTLSGQMYAPWGIDEIETVKSITGKYPAIRGEDFISESANNREVQLAIDWWKAGGIPTIMWHWGAPTVGEGYENSKGTIDVTKCFQTGSAENVAMMADLKRIADHLVVLRDAKVPVLWRPMHESDGNWFWWSKSGGANYVKLWRVMFDYFTKDRKLNNLIWVSCHSGTLKSDYNPGAGYYDIAGGDTYASSSDPQLGIFNAATKIYGSTIPKTLHECGILPDPDKAFSQGATWSWWMLWHTSFLENHDKAELKRIYNHALVITRDELPDLKLAATKIGERGPREPRSFTANRNGNILEIQAEAGTDGIEMIQPSTGRRIAKSQSGVLTFDRRSLLSGIVVVRTHNPSGWSQAYTILP